MANQNFISKACKYIRKANGHCSEYAEKVYDNAPKDSCNKEQLISIILSCDISSSEEAMVILGGKLKYHNRIFGDSPDNSMIENPENLSAYLWEENNYKAMINALDKYIKAK